MAGYEVNLPPEEPPRSSLLDDRDDQPCPSCGKPLATGVVVCMSCGFDMLSGSKAKTTVGEEFKEAQPEPIVSERGLRARAAVTVGVVLMVAAILGAGWFMKPEAGWWVRLLRCSLVVVQTGTGVGAGLVACWCAAQLQRRKLGSAELAAARMFAVVAAFLLVLNVSIPIPVLGALFKAPLAAGVYWVGVKWLIGRDNKTTLQIAVVHAVVCTVMLVQTYLWSLTSADIVW